MLLAGFGRRSSHCGWGRSSSRGFASSSSRHQHQHASPLFVHGEQLHPLLTPRQFYDTLMAGIATAQRRICMAALYLGTGQLERDMVQALAEAMRARPNLTVDLLLDHSRGLRGAPDRSSIATLTPLLQEFGPSSPAAVAAAAITPQTAAGVTDKTGETAARSSRLRVLLYQMPQLRRAPGAWAPSPVNEMVSVTHLKAFVFDDGVVLSGANLSADYFASRQDRYLHVRACSALADAYCGLVEALAPACHAATRAAALLPPPPHLADAAAEGRRLRETLAQNFLVSEEPAARKALENVLLGTALPQPPAAAAVVPAAAPVVAAAAAVAIGEEAAAVWGVGEGGADTLLLPTLQHASLGIRGDAAALSALLSTCTSAAAEQRGWSVDLATAYLNPPQGLLAQLAVLSRTGAARVLSASQCCHGFADAAGIKAAVPVLYSALRGRVATAGVPLLEYGRQGWTFHAKGVWGWPFAPNGSSSGDSYANRGGDAAPAFTVVGSSNFNIRSAERDLESQVVVVTRNAALQARLRREWEGLLEHAAPAPPGRDAAAAEQRRWWWSVVESGAVVRGAAQCL